MELYPLAMHTAPEGVFLSTISVLATLFGWKFASPFSHAPKAMPKTKEPASKAFVTPPISSPDHHELGFEVLAISLRKNKQLFVRNAKFFRTDLTRRRKERKREREKE